MFYTINVLTVSNEAYVVKRINDLNVNMKIITGWSFQDETPENGHSVAPVIYFHREILDNVLLLAT